MGVILLTEKFIGKKKIMGISLIQLDRDKKITSLLKDLKNHISHQSSKKYVKYYCTKLSKILNIPSEVLQKEIKIILFKNFENQNGKFNKIFLLRYVFFYSLKFIIINLYILFNWYKYIGSNNIS